MLPSYWADLWLSLGGPASWVQMGLGVCAADGGSSTLEGVGGLQARAGLLFNIQDFPICWLVGDCAPLDHSSCWVSGTLGIFAEDPGLNPGAVPIRKQFSWRGRHLVGETPSLWSRSPTFPLHLADHPKVLITH